MASCAVVLTTMWVLAVAPASLAATEEYFTAAAFELVPEYACDAEEKPDVRAILGKNLDHITQAVQIAAQRDVDIISFPEHSTVPDCLAEDFPRLTIFPYLERIPDPQVECVTPCDNPEEFKDRIQLYTLSCLAKNHSMFIQINMGDLVDCDPWTQFFCPYDGHLQLNTNVVFDRNGTIVLRYHKEHVWNEPGFDLPLAKQNPIFVTDFGTFASFACFDIVLARIVEVVGEPGVDGVIFSTMWENSAPLYMSVQYFESWAMGNNKTLIAADLQVPGALAVGSGIFHGRDGALVYTFDPDGISKLLVARVPRAGHTLTEPKASITAITPTKIFPWEHDGVAVSFEGGETGHHPKDIMHVNRYHQVDLSDFTMIHLTEPEDELTACHNEMCCHLKYSADVLEEKFYLAAFNGSQSKFSPVQWCEEDCMVVRCEDKDTAKCSVFPMRSYTPFRYLKLNAEFSTNITYPSVVSDAMRLVSVDEWTFKVSPASSNGLFETTIEFDSPSGQDLLEVGLKGRCFPRDSETSFF